MNLLLFTDTPNEPVRKPLDSPSKRIVTRKGRRREAPLLVYQWEQEKKEESRWRLSKAMPNRQRLPCHSASANSARRWLRSGCRSFNSPRASIWRMRSRVMP
jgi:hypothetical protein